MEAWVKPRDGADMMVMGHGGGGQLFISGGKLAFRQVQDTIHSNAAVPPGVWSHVGATWDGHNTRLYVNGHQVAHSTYANKPPSGTSTFYVGYGEMAPWFHGDMDEAAYYDHALTAHDFDDRHKIGTANDHPSLESRQLALQHRGPVHRSGRAEEQRPLRADQGPRSPTSSCSDPDDLPGDSDIASCTATVDGNPISPTAIRCPTRSAPTPSSSPPSTRVATSTTTPTPTRSSPSPTCSATTTRSPTTASAIPPARSMVDSSGNHRDGEYKNDQDSGPVGISGDGDRARDFFGAGGYGYVNGIAAPPFQIDARGLGQRRRRPRRLDRRPRRRQRRRRDLHQGRLLPLPPHGHRGRLLGPGQPRSLAAGRRHLGRRRHPHLRRRRRDRQGRADQAAQLGQHLLRRLRRDGPLVPRRDRRGRLLRDGAARGPRLPALARRPAARRPRPGSRRPDRSARRPGGPPGRSRGSARRPRRPDRTPDRRRPRRPAGRPRATRRSRPTIRPSPPR